MATLASRINSLATRVATETKSLRTLLNGNAADLTALTTTAKTNLVAAINELNAALASAGAHINDAATNGTETWSSTKINTSISAAITALTTGAPGLLDTLDELAAAIGDDANFSATIATALGNRVRTDTAAQGLDSTQKGNARTNIGAQEAALIGDPDTDFVATFNAGLA